jgi:hydrogenase expression/formation protein HypE
MHIFEENIPIREDVRYICDALGFDPLTVANEGAAVIIIPPEEAREALEIIKAHPYGEAAAICGEITETKSVLLETKIGGKRYIDYPAGENLPRIC